MTSRELKNILDIHINSLSVVMQGSGNNCFFILVAPHHYDKAKYSCTTDEQDFKFINGKLTYKGFEISKSKGISPYRK